MLFFVEIPTLKRKEVLDMDIWGSVSGWITEKILDHIFQRIKQINVRYQKILRWLGIFFLIISIICLGWHMLSDALYLRVTELSFAQDNSPITQEIYARSLPSFLMMFTGIIDLIIWAAYGLLCVEKKQNAEVFRAKIDEKDAENRRKRRESLAKNIRIANLLTAYVHQHDNSLIDNEKWISIQGNDKQLIAYRKIVVTHYFKLFDDYCKKIISFIAPHIREINPDDTVNISIKLFFESATGTTKVICLGRALFEDNAQSLESVSERICDDWDKILSGSYAVTDDYALSLIMNPSSKHEVFRCGNISEYKKTVESVSLRENTPKYRYRIPADVTRNFNATLVCPILMYESISTGTYRVAGALCLDTTNSYSDWNTNQSFEENVISFAAACIAPLIEYSMKDLKTINDAMKKAA